MDLDGRSRRKEQDSESIQLLDGFLRVSQFVRLRFNDWLDRFNLNDGRHSVLAVLARTEAGVCTQAQLAERLGQSESNVSTLIERMQRDGLVSRTKSETDRRKRLLKITAAGRAILDAIDADRNEWAESLLKGFQVDDRARLLELVGRFGKMLDPSLVPPSRVSTEEVARKEAAKRSEPDPSENPLSPQFALRQMLQALSLSGELEAQGQEAA